ncbi:MAG TPA: protein translocase subunit SecD [Verrucomicrobiae bacterium]|nr:protein translocase subunit SecD [Verrucomicrobiae bacterium]
MKKSNNLWKFLFVLFIICWSFIQMYPPKSRDLVKEFASRAVNTDATFTNIMERVDVLQQERTNSEFANLRAAIGTNNIQPYFHIAGADDALDPTVFILNQLQREASGKIKLGLDLQGGTAFIMEMDTNALEQAVNNGQTNNFVTSQETANAIAQAVDVLRKRVDRFGVAEPVIQPEGANQIQIQLPGLSEADKASAEANLTNAAFLEFRMVKEDSDQYINPDTGQIIKPIPPGYEVLKHAEPPQNGKPQSPEIVVVRKSPEPGLSGDIVTSARMGRGNLGEPLVEFELTDTAGKRFGEVTRNNIGRRLAIVLDGRLYSAPRINSEIDNRGEITGHFTQEEAQKLAAVLQNPLRAPLHVISSYDVAPTLGRDSIHSGIMASLMAVILVSGFMLIYYRVAGLTANIALITNIIILLGVMCSVGTTFTLPGIAGVVLTIGMAVDANVLIYERLREELAKGKSLRGAIAAGYDRAFGTIFDSHVTTLISSVILIFLGTGEIKGFGVTLTIGVAASLFTALVVTRLIFDFLLDRNWLKSLGMFHLIRATNVNFMGVAKPLFIATWLFVVLSLGFGVYRGPQMFGVDFRGGDSVTFGFVQKPSEKDVRAALADIGEKDAQIQFQTDVASGKETMRVTTSSGTAARVETDLEQKFPQSKLNPLGTKTVGATVGKDIRNSAIIASLMALFGILVYVAFRYEFSFAVGAIVGVVHDVFLTVGCYCLAKAATGRQFNTTVVAAVLTIIGFSINDKVVIFDRIREDLKLGMRGTFKEIINAALNQTLSRTIITSGTVFLATACLYVWGGGAINDFAFTFLIGIVTGTYSSIYIASAFVLWWHKGQRPNIGASAVTVQNASSAQP